jgi:GNAT superfamily N-acetyltransferase
MPIHLELVPAEQTERLVSVLQDADEGQERIRATLADPAHTSYAALEGAMLIGAATTRWEPEESEIIYIAVVPERRGGGAGKAIIFLLLEEARRRSVRSVLVGTADASLENIAFYLKCGFRMDHVRRDYFSYIQPPLIHNGIVMRDMIVFRFDI